jgi:hypothetical protein
LATAAIFIYERYAAPIVDTHSIERLQHAHLLNAIWLLCFYGAGLTLVASAIGRGMVRVAGIGLSVLSFLYAMMTLGAMCGPYNC